MKLILLKTIIFLNNLFQNISKFNNKYKPLKLRNLNRNSRNTSETCDVKYLQQFRREHFICYYY